MKVGNLVKVRVEWEWCYPRYKGVIGLVVSLRTTPKHCSVRFMHGDHFTSMPIDCLEVV